MIRPQIQKLFDSFDVNDWFCTMGEHGYKIIARGEDFPIISRSSIQTNCSDWVELNMSESKLVIDLIKSVREKKEKEKSDRALEQITKFLKDNEK